MATANDLPRDQIVTASDLVRHFGEWQERATQTPVYIMHRGRPRLVLMSALLMEGMASTHGQDNARAPRAALAALLDASREMILLVDERLILTGLSRSARVHFGPVAQPGVPLSALVDSPACQFVLDTAVRTLANGVPETIEIDSHRKPGRRLSVATEPHPAGVALLFKDVTDEYANAEAKAQALALREAVQQTGISAIARINLRGVLDHADPSLVDMTGIAESALSGIKFSNLIEIGTRIGVSSAVDEVMSTGKSQALDATLLVARADPVAVRIGIGAVRRGATVESALALISKAA